VAGDFEDFLGKTRADFDGIFLLKLRRWKSRGDKGLWGAVGRCPQKGTEDAVRWELGTRAAGGQFLQRQTMRSRIFVLNVGQCTFMLWLDRVGGGEARLRYCSPSSGKPVVAPVRPAEVRRECP